MKKYLVLLSMLCSFIFPGKAQNYWWNQSTAYEIFVRSYYDSNGDGFGDFNGITQKLDYLNDNNPNTKTDLGVKLIWLMPINASPSDHGYDVTNYKALNPKYGSLNDFKNLLTQAHARGIKVVMDFVMNHSSDQHPWFIKSASNDPFYRNFYRWETNPGNPTGPWGQQLWYSKNGSNYYGLFWSGMPDLNYTYQPVKDSIFDAAKFWIKEIGVDGFRLDAAMYLFEEGTTLKNHPKTIAFWREFNDSCKSWNSNSLLVGEVWDAASSIALYKNKLDLCFDFNLSDANMYAINNGDPYASRLNLNNNATIFNPNQSATFLTNHDQNRVIDVFSANLEKNKAAASLLLTQPGVPFIYYGEEVAMKGSKPDGNIRRPMQWSNTTNAGFTTENPWYSLNSNYATFNVSTLKADPNSIWNHYQKLIAIRNSEQALMVGSYKNLISNQNKVHTYQRSYEGSEIIVMVNTSNEAYDSVLFTVTRADGANWTYQIQDIYNDSEFMNYPNWGNLYKFILPLKPYQTRILKFAYITGLEPTNWNPDIKLFPNPSNGAFNIEMNQINEPIELSVFSMDGKEVYASTITQKNNTYFINQEAGIYFIKLKNKNGQTIIKKLLITN
ncbi:MAG: alpha-amylase [Bacteroidetes bacterium B1(2017)]|nr:MAG: alpha-amylase [Bacteroidetes bacterium B1(2017)]